MSDAIAYFDRDWLPVAEGAPTAGLVWQHGTLSWRGTLHRVAGVEADADGAAARALGELAVRAASAVANVPAGEVEVVGRGFVAACVRRIVGANGASARVPRAVVDATGDPGEIESATRRLADLGLLVLAGETGARRVEIDLYPDVHVRGLRLVGVPLLAPNEPVGPLPDWFDDYVARNPPALLGRGEQTPSAAWVKVGA